MSQTNPTQTTDVSARRIKRYPYMLTLHISERQKVMLDCLSRRMQAPVSELIRRVIDELIEKYGGNCEEVARELADEEFPTIRGR
jgi:translation initiation factor 2 alpha subunit (eIF-2alpha)